MEATRVEVHPAYGAIYRVGEFVQYGSVLGLSTDSRRVVKAPVSGWVQSLGSANRPDPIAGLIVTILPRASQVD